MRASNAGQFPLETVTQAIGVANVQLSGIRRGVRYRVVSDQDCWIAYNRPAVVGQDLFLPAKMPDYFAFGMADSLGVDLTINVIAAFNGIIYLTPITTVPTEG
jgi:hypothetical protein